MAGAIIHATYGSPFDPVSPQATAIRDLFAGTLLLCSAILFLVICLVLYSVIRFRAVDGREAEQFEGSRRLETAWTIAPAVILAGLLVLTADAMDTADPPISREPDVTIIGHQWWWEARYPSGVVTANEIHIPTGKALVVRLESADVIHDFWVPELGRKMDATPGQSRSIWLEADRPGHYAGACAEYCGVQHAWMRTLVVAETPALFAEWQRHQLTPAPPPAEATASRGAATFDSMTCANCHAISGRRSNAAFAPDLTHLASRTTLGAGVVANTPIALASWLRNPQELKAGCHMPNAQLTDAQVGDLVAYFETLQ
jgi:cytochrome c oxidase subunit 2